MEEGWIRATQKGLHSPWSRPVRYIGEYHEDCSIRIKKARASDVGLWTCVIQGKQDALGQRSLNNLFVYCIGKLIVWILKLYVHLLLQYKTILLKFKFIIRKIYNKFVNRLIIKKSGNACPMKFGDIGQSIWIKLLKVPFGSDKNILINPVYKKGRMPSWKDWRIQAKWEEKLWSN